MNWCAWTKVSRFVRPSPPFFDAFFFSKRDFNDDGSGGEDDGDDDGSWVLAACGPWL